MSWVSRSLKCSSCCMPIRPALRDPHRLRWDVVADRRGARRRPPAGRCARAPRRACAPVCGRRRALRPFGGVLAAVAPTIAVAVGPLRSRSRTRRRPARSPVGWHVARGHRRRRDRGARHRAPRHARREQGLVVDVALPRAPRPGGRGARARRTAGGAFGVVDSIGSDVLGAASADSGRQGHGDTRVGRRSSAVCFLGDDLGDLPAFAELQRLAGEGVATARVAVRSDEAPQALLDAADLVVDGPEGALRPPGQAPLRAAVTQPAAASCSREPIARGSGRNHRSQPRVRVFALVTRHAQRGVQRVRGRGDVERIDTDRTGITELFRTRPLPSRG